MAAKMVKLKIFRRPLILFKIDIVLWKQFQNFRTEKKPDKWINEGKLNVALRTILKLQIHTSGTPRMSSHAWSKES